MFRVVFVPGLAERMFPQKPRQDPLLSDRVRASIDPRLATRADQGDRERLLLHLAVGAATERVVAIERGKAATIRLDDDGFRRVTIYRVPTCGEN